MRVVLESFLAISKVYYFFVIPRGIPGKQKQTDQPNHKSTIININDYSTEKKLDKSNII